MISLGTHQAATWGYSTRDIPSLAGAYGSSSYIGLFTKPTLAPNGNMYAILGVTALNVSGTYEAFVIMKITPGNTNTATTNYTPPTISYLIADNGFAANGSGFAKPSWGAPSAVSGNNTDNSLFRFNTGILAPNGLIYFPPVQCGSGKNKWVIFNPASDLWKVTEALRPSGLTQIGNQQISCAVLGTDNKIYVLSSFGKAFRITTSANALSDTVEDSYHAAYASTASPLGIGTIPLGWRDEAGVTYTSDTASLDGVLKAHDNDSSAASAASYRIFTTISDAIVHPSGRIYLMPGRGRGRIFYINQSAWGTIGEIVSAPGLSTASIAGYGQKTIHIKCAFLEKPRDAGHTINTLKIYLVPSIQVGIPSPNNICTDILVIDPVTQTMSALPMQYVASSTSQSTSTLSKLINLPNGMILTYNRIATSGSASHGGMILTGWDVPSTDSNGARTIPVPDKGIMQDQGVVTIATLNPSFTSVGGGTNAMWPHNGKFIGMFNPVFNPGDNQFSEIVSVKGYHPDVTNFNFSQRDRTFYGMPSDLALLGPSVYNCQFNKPK
jgi:hypothetical protein